MLFHSKSRLVLLTAILAVIAIGGWQTTSAEEDLTHIVKGTVKSVDKATKTMVIKAGDGTEHTVKWTDKTTVAGGKDVGDAVADGSKVSVKYTEKAGEKTAVGIKTAAKATADAVK